MANIEPNKYLKNKDIKPESKGSVFIAVIRMGLMISGIIGIMLDLFRDDSLIIKAVASLFQSTASMVLIPVIILALWLLNRWISTPNKSETKKSGDLPMYIMMAIGAFYLYRLFTTGSF